MAHRSGRGWIGGRGALGAQRRAAVDFLAKAVFLSWLISAPGTLLGLETKQVELPLPLKNLPARWGFKMYMQDADLT